MDVCGVVSPQLLSFSDGGTNAHFSMMSFPGASSRVGAFLHRDLRITAHRSSTASLIPTRLRGLMNSGFGDKGHLQYYYEGPRCGGKKAKDKEKINIEKKMKFLKALSKELSASQFTSGSDPDHALVCQDEGKLVSEAEVLLKQLQQLRGQVKELKKKGKEEKAELRAARIQNVCDYESSSSSSSSESSESECGDVSDMSCLRSKSLLQPKMKELKPFTEKELEVKLTLSSLLAQQRDTAQEGRVVGCTLQNPEEGCCNGTSTNCSRSIINHEISSQSGRQLALRIEVCMGNKCKKSGGASLLDEFERMLGVEGGAVVSCKCMGKCKTGPNVRLLNCVDEIPFVGSDYSVRTTNLMFNGVRLEDVDDIVVNFLGERQKYKGVEAAA